MLELVYRKSELTGKRKRIRGKKTKESEVRPSKILNALTPAQLEERVREIIRTSSSGDEVCRRIAAEIGYPEHVELLFGWKSSEVPALELPAYSSTLLDGHTTVMAVLHHKGEIVLV